MKNFKKIAFGLLVGVLSIGFSAFTNAHKKLPPQTFTFVHLTHDGSNNRTDYVYRANLGNCLSSSNNCTSLWTENITGTPAEGANPIPSATQGAITLGDYQGN